MIEQLKKQNTWGECLEKIDEIIGVVNALEECVDSLRDMVNIHEKEIDKLQMEIAPEKCDYEDEKDWIGKLCKFRDGGYAPWQYGILTDITPGVEFPYWMRDIEFAECQPVSEEEFKDVIYKKGQK